MDIKELENRFKFHPANTEQRQTDHETVREMCRVFAETANILLPDGREKSLAMTHLEEVMFWANASLARAPEQLRLF